MTTWNIDTTHSSINFSVRHMMIAKVRGSFRSWSGSVALDEGDVAHARFLGEIDAASIDTSEPKRDGHLKSADFFDVEKFPKITFASKRVDGAGDRFKVVGDLAMHGVTKEISLDVSREGAGKDPWGNERVAFTARGSLNRIDFGLKWNQALEAGGVLVGEKIDIEIELSTVKAK